MIKIKEYILSIIICGVICSLICHIFRKNSTAGVLIKISTGIFMMITIIAPIAKIQLPDLVQYYDSIHMDASSITKKSANEAMIYASSIIKDRTTAYILDKAAAMNIDITVDIALSETDPPVPAKVYISGNISPYEKSVLSDYIQTNLNISRENQIWI